jgi:hypothetical protein
MQSETLMAVTEELKRRGVPARFEPPHSIVTDFQYNSPNIHRMTLTASETPGLEPQVFAVEFRQDVDDLESTDEDFTMKSQIPIDSEDIQAIADFFQKTCLDRYAELRDLP